MAPFPQSKQAPRASAGLLVTLAGLMVVLGLLFARSLSPEQILFSSDGPLGASSTASYSLPGIFSGIWRDLNWVGGWGGSAAPTVTNLWLWTLGPVGFAKLYAPLSLLVLGVSVWLLFRQLGFRPWVGALGAIAGALNTDFFSYACWGLGTLVLSAAWTFVALAALATTAANRFWLRAGVAGFAVGMAVMEGYDAGAIFSLYVAAFVMFQALQPGVGQWRAWLAGIGRVGVVAACAALVATAALGMLITTQIKGVAGMEQDSRSKAQRWEDATQWSLPKLETLRVVIPGLFGYRMDTADGGNYWGRVGERAEFLPRHSGSGVYGGVTVVLLAVFALAQALRGAAGPFTAGERRAVWFWGVATVLSLLFAWGKHAPFYQFLYALPYFSTIRNPIKFMHPFSLGLIILFGYGLHALGRLYFEKAVKHAGGVTTALKRWWAAANPFERKWCLGCGLALGASLLGWLLYLASRTELENHLKTAISPDLAPVIARFSLAEVGWYILFLALSLVVSVLIYCGVFGGARARWGIALLGLVLATDLARASTPWVFYWNYKEKYAANPIVDLLRARPYEQRVALLPFQLGEQYALFQQLYHAEWLQHAFQYYNVQALDIIQDPRPAIENLLYRAAFASQREPGLVRQWQLTNTRFLFGLAGGVVELLNEKLDPGQKRFRLHTAFALGQDKPGGPILVQTNTTGPFALIEFTGALPRTKLYSRWVVNTNDDLTLQMLTDPTFDPAQTVVVSNPAISAPSPAATNQTPGSVEVTSYAPKAIRLKARAAGPSVLLWNDKYDPQWAAKVDGAPQPVLRCNYLMRGVQVPAGEHTVEFGFKTPLTPLYTSLAAMFVGLGLTGWLFLGGTRPAASPKAGVDQA